MNNTVWIGCDYAVTRFLEKEDPVSLCVFQVTHNPVLYHCDELAIVLIWEAVKVSLSLANCSNCHVDTVRFATTTYIKISLLVLLWNFDLELSLVMNHFKVLLDENGSLIMFRCIDSKHPTPFLILKKSRLENFKVPWQHRFKMLRSKGEFQIVIIDCPKVLISVITLQSDLDSVNSFGCLQFSNKFKLFLEIIDVIVENEQIIVTTCSLMLLSCDLLHRREWVLFHSFSRLKWGKCYMLGLPDGNCFAHLIQLKLRHTIIMVTTSARFKEV